MSALPFLLIIALAGYAFLAAWPAPKKRDEEDESEQTRRYKEMQQ